MDITISHMREVRLVIDDYVYIAYFKTKWKEITKELKSYGCDYSHIQITKEGNKIGHSIRDKQRSQELI